MSWLQSLPGADGASLALRQWADEQPSAAAAWNACPRGDWQLWLAAHAPALTSDQEHSIMRAALDYMPESALHWVVAGFRLLPTKMDTLDAWTAKRHGRLGFAAGLAASSAAFVIALVFGAVIDRAAGAHFSTGATRFLIQNALVIALLIPLTPLLRAIWLAQLDRAVAQLSFVSAFDEIHHRYARITERASAPERRELADNIRASQYALGIRAFPS